MGTNCAPAVEMEDRCQCRTRSNSLGIEITPTWKVMLLIALCRVNFLQHSVLLRLWESSWSKKTKHLSDNNRLQWSCEQKTWSWKRNARGLLNLQNQARVAMLAPVLNVLESRETVTTSARKRKVKSVTKLWTWFVKCKWRWQWTMWRQGCANDNNWWWQWELLATTKLSKKRTDFYKRLWRKASKWLIMPTLTTPT